MNFFSDSILTEKLDLQSKFCHKVMVFNQDVILFSPDELVQLAYEILEGLVHLNKQGIVHRNLDADNILIEPMVILLLMLFFLFFFYLFFFLIV